MADMPIDGTALQQQLAKQQQIVQAISAMFAPEDEGLKGALVAAKEAGLPEIQISALQGKFLQLLATLCHAKKILEIGSLAGYSGIWLARALPADGRFITLEINPKHAEVVRHSYAQAGIADRAEVRVGNALETLPTLITEAPFDVVFIDADKPAYPQYLEWALKLTRPGSLIVADNCIRGGDALQDPAQVKDAFLVGIAEYNKRITNDPRLLSLALAMDDEYEDGFALSVVLS